MHQLQTKEKCRRFEIVDIVNILYSGFMKHYTLLKHKGDNILEVSHTAFKQIFRRIHVHMCKRSSAASSLLNVSQTEPVNYMTMRSALK